MSYFSHNPEQWDGIEHKAMASWFQSEGCTWDTEELVEYIEDSIWQEQPDLYDRLRKAMPLRFTTEAEQDFWGSMADGYLAMGDG